jgi:hypothetical protein
VDSIPAAIVAGVIGGAGAVAAAFITYLVARRQSSGRIATSDAATLWAESQSMRKELRDECESLRGEVGTLRGEVVFLRGEVSRLRQRLTRYERSDE